MDVSKNQIIEIQILIDTYWDLISSGIEGVASVAKKIQIYLDCTFTEACEVLQIFIQEN